MSSILGTLSIFREDFLEVITIDDDLELESMTLCLGIKFCIHNACPLGLMYIINNLTSIVHLLIVVFLTLFLDIGSSVGRKTYPKIAFHVSKHST